MATAFEQGDAQIHPFPAAGFDVAVSRFGIMFFADRPGRLTGRQDEDGDEGNAPVQEVLMMHQNYPLAHAQQTAHEWLEVVAERLGTEDRNYTYRVLRTWLHLVRDRLSVDSAVHLAAQLPEFLRGIMVAGTWQT